MSKVADSFIEQRAYFLAMVQLTTRPDLIVNDFPEEDGLDLLVRIASSDQGYQKFFGVVLKGTNRRLPTSIDATKLLRRRLKVISSPGRIAPKYAFPVFALIFSMVDDKGYIAWTFEPVFNHASEPRLKSHDSPFCEPFNRVSLESVVEQINQWHDRLFPMIEMD